MDKKIYLTPLILAVMLHCNKEKKQDTEALLPLLLIKTASNASPAVRVVNNSANAFPFGFHKGTGCTAATLASTSSLANGSASESIRLDAGDYSIDFEAIDPVGHCFTGTFIFAQGKTYTCTLDQTFNMSCATN